MSVFIASFLNGGKSLIMGADSRASVIVDGVTYKDHDNVTKLYFRDDGVAFYCSGVLSMAQEVADTLFILKNIGHREVLNTLTSVYNKYLELNPSISQIKYALQFVIPFQEEDGLWRISYYDSENNFEPYIYGAQPNTNFVFGIGMGSKIVHPIIDNALQSQNEVDIFKLYQQAYSEAANEVCGGNLTIVAYVGNDIITQTLKITDKRKIRELDKLKILTAQHGQGDGVIVTPDNKPVSGVATIKKNEGFFDIIYRNSNYAKERRLIMQDDGVELSTETGNVVIGHDNGSYIKIKSNGDIEINAIGKIHFNGGEYKFE